MADEVEPLEARSNSRIVVAFVFGAVALVVVPLVLSRIVAQPEGDVHRYEIPSGTAAALARGETIDVLPAELRLGLRDTLVVVNHDTQSHQVGPYLVAAGAQFSRDADELTSFIGFCSLHPAGRIDIQIDGPDR